MAVELATGYISLVPSTKGIGRGLARELNGPLVDAGRKAGDDSSSAFSGRFTAGLKTAAKSAGIALGVAFGAAGTYGVKVAADFQQTRIAFEGILGSAEEANKRLSELQQFAAGTPFEFAGLAESAQQLLAVGFTADEIIPTMTKLGNVAATLGVGEAEIKGVVRALGQMRGKGKASAEELQQISEQIPGFSAIGAIAEDMGISTADAFKKLEKGAIPADAAIESILAGMEKFPGAAGAMERQSKTLNGVLSTFKDTIDLALIQGIEPFLPAISGALSGSIPVVQKFIDVTIGGVAGVVTGFGEMAGAVKGFVEEINRGDVGAGIAVEIGILLGLAEDHPIVDALATALTAVGDAAAWAFDGLSGFASIVTSEFAAAITAAKDAWADYAQLGIGPVAEHVGTVRTALGDINELFEEQRDILIPLAGAAAGLAAAFAAFQIVEAVQVAISSMSLLAPVIAGITAVLGAPVLLIVGAVLAVAGAFAAAYTQIQPFRDAVDGFVDILGDLASRAVEFVSGLVDTALPVLKDFVESVIEVAGAIVSGFSQGFRALGGVIQRNIVKPLRPLGRFLSDDVAPAFEAFGAFVSALFARISDVVGPVVTLLSAQLGALAGVVADTVGPAFDILAGVVNAAYEIISVLVSNIASVLAPILGTAFDLAVVGIDVAWSTMTSIIRAAFEIIEGIFDVLTGILTGDFAKAWEGLVEIVGAPFRAMRDIVVNVVEELIGFLGTLPERTGDFITAAFGGAVETATTIFGSIVDLVTTTWDGIVETFTGLPGRINEATLGMWDGIAEAFEGVINWIIDAWNGLEFKLPEKKVFGQTIGGFTLGTPKIDHVDFADGGIVTARPGGLVGRLGEAGRDELVAPLPNGFDIADLARPAASSGFRDLVIHGELGEDPVARAFHEARKRAMVA